MKKMKFKKTIKYNGVVYPAGSIVEVEDADVEGLTEIGGKTSKKEQVEETEPESKKAEPQDDEEEEAVTINKGKRKKA